MGFASQKMTPKKLQDKLTLENTFNFGDSGDQQDQDFDIFDYQLTDFKANPFATDDS